MENGVDTRNNTQSALDLTGYGGRVVLGSWYGGGAAQLNLGMAFHRSHLTIQTSQVRQCKRFAG